MAKGLYVVRSAEFDPVHYGAFDSVEKAQEFIDHLYELPENEDDYDYDFVEYFDTVEEAIASFEEQEG